MASGSIVRPFVVPDGLSQIELGEEIDLMLKSGRAIVWQNGQGALIGLDIAPLTSTGEEARLAFLQKWRSLLPSCEFSSELISTDSSSYHRHSSKLQEIFDLSTPTDGSVFHVGHDSVRIYFKGNFTVDNGLLGSTLQLAMYLKECLSPSIEEDRKVEDAISHLILQSRYRDSEFSTRSLHDSKIPLKIYEPMEVKSYSKRVNDDSFLTIAVTNMHPSLSLIVQSIYLNIAETRIKRSSSTDQAHLQVMDASASYRVQLINILSEEEIVEAVIFPKETYCFVFKISPTLSEPYCGGENMSNVNIIWRSRHQNGKTYPVPSVSSYPVEWLGVQPDSGEFELVFKGPFVISVNTSALLDFYLKNNTSDLKTIKLVTESHDVLAEKCILFHERELNIENLQPGKSVEFSINVLAVKEGVANINEFTFFDDSQETSRSFKMTGSGYTINVVKAVNATDKS